MSRTFGVHALAAERRLAGACVLCPTLARGVAETLDVELVFHPLLRKTIQAAVEHLDGVSNPNVRAGALSVLVDGLIIFEAQRLADSAGVRFRRDADDVHRAAEDRARAIALAAELHAIRHRWALPEDARRALERWEAQ